MSMLINRLRRAGVAALGLGWAATACHAEQPVAPAPSAAQDGRALGADEGKLMQDGWQRDVALGLGLVLISATLDRSGQDFAQDHGGKGGVKTLANLGNALPLLALGGAGLAAVGSSDPRLSRTGWAAVQAGGASVLGGLALKHAIGRARPDSPGASPGDFFSDRDARGDSSMPSIHAAAMWGAVTPFAKEYDQPWLYGVAALTNFARVAKNKHWVSDTVAGSLLGYGLGTLAWRWNRQQSGVVSSLVVHPRGVVVRLNY